MRLTKFITDEERIRIGDESVARGGYRNGVDAGFTPGMGWFMPWIYDPAGNGGKRMMIKSIDALHDTDYLSVHYKQDWAHIRPPICIVGPNGQPWEIDRKSSNGDGWRVTGEWPNLTCTPSIVLDGYHGFLTSGAFSPDVDGRNWPDCALPWL